MAIKKLTIIIVTFESSEIIKGCLRNLNTDKYDVVIVDNNSQDNTVKIVQENFPEVRIIKLEQNIGYGRANNVVLRGSETDYALILNPDAIILENDIDHCVDLLCGNKDIALASPKICASKDLDTPRVKNDRALKNKYNYESLEFVVGGVMFMNLDIFRRIGFFDEEIFMFSEDNELSNRSIKSGHKNVVINSALAFHSGAGSTKKSLRNTYRRFWHLGWSKSQYRQNRKGKLSAKRATLRLSVVYFVEGIWYCIRLNLEKSISKMAFCFGCFSSLIGLKAFKKNGSARG